MHQQVFWIWNQAYGDPSRGTIPTAESALFWSVGILAFMRTVSFVTGKALGSAGDSYGRRNILNGAVRTLIQQDN